VLRWLAQPHILQATRAQFEGMLINIAEYSEEWLTSAQSLNLTARQKGPNVLPRSIYDPAASRPRPVPMREA
jgi:hypothetical protein